MKKVKDYNKRNASLNIGKQRRSKSYLKTRNKV